MAKRVKPRRMDGISAVIKRESAVNLSDWQLQAVDDFADAIRTVALKAASEVLREYMNSNNTCDFPIRWGPNGDGWHGKAPTDPLTIYLELPLDENDDNPHIFEFNLRDGLASTLESCADDGSFSSGLELIRDSLRELANKIDAAITSGTAAKP